MGLRCQHIPSSSIVNSEDGLGQAANLDNVLGYIDIGSLDPIWPPLYYPGPFIA